MTQSLDDTSRVDLWTPESRGEDHQCSDDETFCGTIDISEVERMGVECLPGREPHWQAGKKADESARLGGTHCQSSDLKQTGEGAIQGIDSMTESRWRIEISG